MKCTDIDVTQGVPYLEQRSGSWSETWYRCKLEEVASNVQKLVSYICGCAEDGLDCYGDTLEGEGRFSKRVESSKLRDDQIQRCP